MHERSADKRSGRRYAKRFQVRFWPVGEERAYTAITSDLSHNGVFITSGRVLDPGSRLRLAFGEGEGRFIIEGIVARVHRVSPTLRQIEKQGMGVRFLTPSELIGELVPTVLGTMESTAGRRGEGARVFRVRFNSPVEFRRAIEKDIRAGGLFLRTEDPPPVDEVVTVMVFAPHERLDPVTLEARVVHRFSGPTPGGGKSITGMGVEFEKGEAAIAELEALLEELDA